jgi:transcription elongation factor GreA
MPNFLTKEGLAELQAELKEINEVLLPQTVDIIEAARSQGDLRENADYEIARNRKDELERRVIEIEDILADYELIETGSGSKTKVQMGSRVKVQYLHDNSTFEMQIVGASEADVLDSRISNESPLAKAVLGKEVGSEVKVDIRLNDVAKTRDVKKVKILDVA